MNLLRTKKFKKSYQNLNLKIQNKTNEVLRIFVQNPFDKKLRNHSLVWKLNWLKSIYVTWDYRIIFRELSSWKYELVELINIWTHNQIYW